MCLLFFWLERYLEVQLEEKVGQMETETSLKSEIQLVIKMQQEIVIWLNTNFIDNYCDLNDSLVESNRLCSVVLENLFRRYGEIVFKR